MELSLSKARALVHGAEDVWAEVRAMEAQLAAVELQMAGLIASELPAATAAGAGAAAAAPAAATAVPLLADGILLMSEACGLDYYCAAAHGIGEHDNQSESADYRAQARANMLQLARRLVAAAPAGGARELVPAEVRCGLPAADAPGAFRVLTSYILKHMAEAAPAAAYVAAATTASAPASPRGAAPPRAAAIRFGAGTPSKTGTGAKAAPPTTRQAVRAVVGRAAGLPEPEWPSGNLCAGALAAAIVAQARAAPAV